MPLIFISCPLLALRCEDFILFVGLISKKNSLVSLVDTCQKFRQVGVVKITTKRVCGVGAIPKARLTFSCRGVVSTAEGSTHPLCAMPHCQHHFPSVMYI